MIRLVSFAENHRTRLDWTAALGEKKSFGLIAQNPFNVSTGFYFSPEYGGNFALKLGIYESSMDVGKATGLLGPGRKINFVDVEIPESGRGLEGAGVYCAAAEANTTVVVRLPEDRAEKLGSPTVEDAAVLKITIPPGLLAKPVYLAKASGNALLWFGNKSFSLADSGKKFKKIVFGGAQNWSYSAVPETFAANCANDYACCSRAFCNQARFNNMFNAFKDAANRTLKATAQRPYRRESELLEKTTGAFVFSTMAFLAPGVVFPPEVSADSCGKGVPGVYLIRARTSDGRTWGYWAEMLLAGGNSRFHGYGNASAGEFVLCGLDASKPLFKCVLAPTISDDGKLKRFGIQ